MTRLDDHIRSASENAVPAIIGALAFLLVTGSIWTLGLQSDVRGWEQNVALTCGVLFLLAIVFGSAPLAAALRAGTLLRHARDANEDPPPHAARTLYLHTMATGLFIVAGLLLLTAWIISVEPDAAAVQVILTGLAAAYIGLGIWSRKEAQHTERLASRATPAAM